MVVGCGIQQHNRHICQFFVTLLTGPTTDYFIHQVIVMLTTRSRWRNRIIQSVTISLIAAVMMSGGAYYQTLRWLQEHQKDSVRVAVRQLDRILDNASVAAKMASSLQGQSCAPTVIQKLRNQMAITPNVGNIELATNDVVYCSTLSGDSRHDVRPSQSLFLSASLSPLQGHPFIILRQGTRHFSVFISTDGYYLSNILESASIFAPVSFVTENGWMDSGGHIHTWNGAKLQNIRINSGKFDYYLQSSVERSEVMQLLAMYGKYSAGFILILSVFLGGVYYFWSGREAASVLAFIRALENKELVPFFQPIVRSNDFKPVGCEVLIRWIHNGKIITPEDFIPFAEKNGLIIMLTRALFAELAESFLQDFHPEESFYISLNISPRHFESLTMPDDFSILTRTLDNRVNLVAEITERDLLADNENVRKNISWLKDEGVQLSLDDYGTGHSALEYLHRFNMDFIKIDKLFISEVGQNSICDSIVANVVDLSERLDLKVVAEGVETKEQAMLLKEYGIDALQGYLFSRPLPVNEFIKYLEESA